MKLSVVMPVYNEAETIREIVAQVLAVPIEKELLIVDDASTDGTREILREMDGRDGVRVFLQPANQGKGAAVSVGFRYAEGDVVVIQDADLETCYKMFRREVVRSLSIESRRFGIEPEITAKVARRGYRIFEVPISYYGRTYDEGKKIGWKDAVSALATIVRHGLREAEDPRNVGHVTLARMGRLEPYNRWLADRFRGALGKRVLE